jgi:hypothetical protein
MKTTTRNPSTIMVFAATICMLFVTSMMLIGTVASTGKTFSQTEVYANVGATAINFIETQTAGSFSGAQMEVAKVGTAILLQTDLNITGQSYVNEDQRTIGDKSVQKAAMEMMQNQEAIQRLSGTMMQSIGVTATIMKQNQVISGQKISLTYENSVSSSTSHTAKMYSNRQASPGSNFSNNAWTATTNLEKANEISPGTFSLNLNTSATSLNASVSYLFG